MKTIICFFLSLSLVSCAFSNAPYVRKDWGYPADEDGNCRNTRAEILIERSEKPVTMRKSGCTVALGQWQDFYFPETITDARKLHIDHVVPLKNAHASGGSLWSREKRRAFANDWDNLVITSSKTNQQKGAKGIEAWVPLSSEYACRYLKRWIRVKEKYGLRISAPERSAVAHANCR